VGKGSTLVTVVLVGGGLLLIVVLLKFLVLVGAHMLVMVGKGYRLLIMVLVLLLVCGTLWLLMPVLVGGKPRVLVLVGGDKHVVCHMCVVEVVSLEGVQLPMVTMNMLLGQSRA
jgi:hypothetical protein